MLYRNPSRVWFVLYWSVGLSFVLMFAMWKTTPAPGGTVVYGDCPDWTVPHAPRAPARTVFTHVNGVDTPPLREFDAICNLGRAVESIGVSPGYAADPLVWVWNSKNRTHVEELLDEDRSATARVVAATWVSAQRFPPPADMMESLRQVRNILDAFPPGAKINPDSRKLARQIREEVLDGRRVILVPHSQGNLIVHEALHVLSTTLLPSEAEKVMRCTAVVGLASPVSVPIRGDVVSTRIMVRGDIIYNPAFRQFTKARPSAAELAATSRSPAPGAEFRVRGLATSLDLHEVTSSYYGDPETRARIVAALDSVYGIMAQRDCAPTPHPRITGTWSGRAATLGTGTLRLSVEGGTIRGTWMRGSGTSATPVAIQLLSRRRMRVTAPDTTLHLYLVNGDGADYRLKVVDDGDEQQGGSLFLDSLE